MSEENNNNGLYFIVGMLLVAVLVIGFLYANSGDAGGDNVVERVIETDGEPDFSVDVNDDGFSASSN